MTDSPCSCARAQLKKDPQLAAAAPDDSARVALSECYDRGGSCNELLETLCRVYSARNVFGSSVGGAADFKFITYAQLWERIKTLAAGMLLSAARRPAALHRTRCISLSVVGTQCAAHVLTRLPRSRLPRSGLAAEDVLKTGDFFGICGFASVDWVNCEFACQYLGAPWTLFFMSAVARVLFARVLSG